MADRSAISWTDATWNPWMGCQHVSPGCLNCYMFTYMRRVGRDPETVVRSKTTFDAPLKWTEPRHIFTCSLSDFFIVEADPWRPDAVDIIYETPQHIYQILTKRPARMVAWALHHGWPPNAWAGTSIESRKYLHRADVLRKVPAATRFLSLEPLLEDLGVLDLSGIAGVIVGGESGPNFRPMDLAWVRPIRDQCIEQGVAFHYKQGAGPRHSMHRELDGRVWNDLPVPEESGRVAVTS